MASEVNKEAMKQCLKDANIYEDNLSDDLISQYYKAIKNSEISLIQESEVEEGTKSLNDSANELLEAINKSESIVPSKKRRFTSKSAEPEEEPSGDLTSAASLEQSKPVEEEANNNSYHQATDSKVKKVQKSSHILDIDKITFNDMPKSSMKNSLKVVIHEPQYIAVQNSRQFIEADLPTRVKLLTDYHFGVAQLAEDFARTLTSMAPRLKPITAVNHNLLVNPVLSALKEEKSLSVTETYVSRSGRMTKRKVYNDDDEVGTEDFPVPPKKSKSDDSWASKAATKKPSSRKVESSEALSSSSSNVAEDTIRPFVKRKRSESPDSSQDLLAADEPIQDATPKGRTYQKRTPSNQEIMSRSALFKDLDTTKRGRSATILNAAKEKDEKLRREEEEMNRFSDSLDSQIVDDENEILASEHVADDDVELVEKRRISPLLPTSRRAVWGKRGSNGKDPLIMRKLNISQTSTPVANGDMRHMPLPKRALNNNTLLGSEASVSTTPKNKGKQNMAVCPLCSMSFSRKEIEEHASTCGEDMFSQSQYQRIACEICDAVVPFSTDYEVHVKECIAKRSSRI